MKGSARGHPKKKTKHSNAGLKIEGLSGNTEGGYTFIGEIQSWEIPVSLCVARCLCKHMNKKEHERENGIHLAHAYKNGRGGGEEKMIAPLLFVQSS